MWLFLLCAQTHTKKTKPNQTIFPFIIITLDALCVFFWCLGHSFTSTIFCFVSRSHSICFLPPFNHAFTIAFSQLKVPNPKETKKCTGSIESFRLMAWCVYVSLTDAACIDYKVHMLQRWSVICHCGHLSECGKFTKRHTYTQLTKYYILRQLQAPKVCGACSM